MIGGPLSWIGELTDQLAGWASNWWFLALILVIALLDSVVPIVPSETAVILGGVACSTGTASYPLWAVIACAATGAFTGDNLSYSIGHRFAARLERRARHNEKYAARLAWARRQMVTRGGPLLITARFIPGGRTALTLTSGITRQPRAWFVGWIAVAAVIWATFAAGLAYAVGKPFADNHRAAFWVAFGTAITFNVLLELVRHLRNRNKAAAGAA